MFIRKTAVFDESYGKGTTLEVEDSDTDIEFKVISFSKSKQESSFYISKHEIPKLIEFLNSIIG